MRPVHFAVILLLILFSIAKTSFVTSFLFVLIVGIIAYSIGDRYLFDHEKKDRYW